MNEEDPKKWRIRRRFAIISFAELVTIPVWGGYVSTQLKLPDDLLIGLMWALVAIIGAYIGGVVIDDNWKK